MELEVRTTAATDNCFVSLPLSLLRTLQSTSPSGFLPPVLALELRSSFGDRRWHVAWSGSASRSSAIEVSQLLSECISLPDRIKVQVKIIQNLPKAEQVAIEPCTADDWEIMELNQELARDITLQQVGVVYEGMKFPLSLGHAVVIFVVVSTLPNKAVVQLVPGVEFIVAPKLRTKASCSYGDVQAPIPSKKQHERKGLLRVQEQGTKVVHKVEFEGMQLGVVLTSAVFVHPETARSLSFSNLQLVRLLPRLFQTENISRNEGIDLRRTEGTKGNNDSSQNKASPRPQIDNVSQHEGSGVRRKEGTEANNDSSPNKASPRPQADNILHHGGSALRRTEDAEGNNGNLPNNASPRHTIVRLLLLDSVARGHIMIPRSLCRFIEAGAHSWVYIVEVDPVPKSTISSLTLSPCQFKLRERGSAAKNVAISSSPGSRGVSAEVDPLLAADIKIHKEFISSLSCISPKNGSEELANKDHTKCKGLIQAWLTGQLNEIALYAGGDVVSVVLTSETLFHFEVTNSKYTRQVKQESSISPMKRTTSDETPVDLLYLLSIKFDGTHTYFEFLSKAQSTGTDEHKDSELNLGNLELEVVSLDTAVNCNLKCDYGPTVSSLSWLETAASNAISRLETLLSPFSAMLLSRHHCPLPGHILIYGPPGSGKTSVTKAIARYFEDHEKILAHVIFVSCSKLPDKSRLEVKRTLKYYISEALVHSPSLLILDDLDHIVYSSSQSEGAQATSTVNGLVEFLADVVDECEVKRQNSCGFGPIAFMASAESLDKLPQSLVSAGRLGLHIVLPTPAAPERAAMLKHEVQGRSLQCGADVLSDVATKCDGYDSYDLDIMLDRAVHVASSRYLSSHTTAKGNDKPLLVKDDFSKAMQDFSPVAMRGLSKMASRDERSGWADVGGLVDIRKTIQEMIEMPSRFPSIFAQAPLRLKSNVLLYGPPGCGKTHIVGAAAVACTLRFKSVKGPELLNKYIGASEQAVRDLFRQAAAAAPCILFFDEFDSIAPKRGHDSTGVTDRVVNQFLTELDGVETLRGVFVFAATSRPDLLDAALLRPGRLDRLLFCDFPTWTERVDVLTVLSRKLPLASDVNLETIASMTEGFSGADLQALLSDSQLAAVHEILDDVDSDKPKEPLITDVLLRSVALKARPSVSESEKRRLNAIYDEFVGARKSVSALSRDAKGKRATLA